ncbi:MAG: putative F420-dependent oxidoreductase, Rv2161c family [Streptosporangiaceae bacterium]|nr:putative F420-dependent oxidoreductase, Rv2161c family [Streptosporangiaceae bacterium]
MNLTIGLHTPNGYVGADRHGAARIASLAEELGYESLWAADHVVLSSPRVEPSAATARPPMAGRGGWPTDGTAGCSCLRATAAQLESLRSAGHGTDRRLHISVSPARRLDPETVRGYADLGVDRLIVVPPAGLPLAELERFLAHNAPRAPRRASSRRLSRRPSCRRQSQPSAPITAHADLYRHARRKSEGARPL